MARRSSRQQVQYKPYCFVCYSTKERHVQFLIDCLKLIFQPHYDVKLTPSALESGASQLQEIVRLITNCSFGIVAIDGLRPNVVFEYGVLHAMKKPIIVLKEAEAEVDIDSYYGDTPNRTAGAVKINFDTQLSDVKDLNYATWTRFSIANTVNVIWSEYSKKRDKIIPYFEIEEPKLW